MPPVGKAAPPVGRISACGGQSRRLRRADRCLRCARPAPPAGRAGASGRQNRCPGGGSPSYGQRRCGQSQCLRWQDRPLRRRADASGGQTGASGRQGRPSRGQGQPLRRAEAVPPVGRVGDPGGQNQPLRRLRSGVGGGAPLREEAGSGTAGRPPRPAARNSTTSCVAAPSPTLRAPTRTCAAPAQRSNSWRSTRS